MRLSAGARAAIRLARRDAMRHKARSATVVMMVALPVLGLGAADVLARTMQLSPTERVTRDIGQADAGLQIVGGRIRQGANPSAGFDEAGTPVTVGTPAYRSLLRRSLALVHANPHVVVEMSDAGTVSAHDRLAQVRLQTLDVADPLTAGVASLVNGRAPASTTEVAVTPHLATRLGVGVGSHVDVGRRPVSDLVVGVVRDPGDLQTDALYGLPGAFPAAQQTLLVTTPRPVTWSQVQALNALGVAVESRAVVEHPPAAATSFGGQRAASSDELGVAGVAVGLAVLEVVLLAGAAFAVGARRQRRDLALIAATGGDQRQVAQVVLGSGLVLGAVGGVIGIVLAGIAARIGLPFLAHFADRDPGHFDLRVPELLGIVALGVLTGLAASILPARAAARDDVVAALSGRREIISTTRRMPILGLWMIVIGAIIAAYAAHPPARFMLVLAGAVIAELGFVVCAPTVVGAVGRLARFVPLSPRLALRDAARHRSRTGPAVAAIMAAIAGSIAVSTYIVSSVAHDRDQYEPQARIGQSVLSVFSDRLSAPARRVTAAEAVARRDLGATGVVPMPVVECQAVRHCHSASVDLNGGDDATPKTPSQIAVGDATLLKALTGRNDPAAVRALAAGRFVVFSPVLTDGRVGLVGSRPETHEPAVLDDVGSSSAAAGAIISPATAARLGLNTAVASYLLDTPKTPTQAEQDRANDDLQAMQGYAEVERGYHQERWSYGLIALALVAGLVTLGATGITTGLSMVESRPDLATLAAVGGAPRTRRLLVANQAGTVALLGALLGVVAGLIPAWAILHANGDIPFVLPWTTIGVTVVGIPLLAVAATAVFAGSRMPLGRRLS